MHEYDLIADWYSTDRDLVTAIPEVTSLIASLPAGASVLDVGCGNGIPITRTLLAAGCDVLGVDSSTKMLAKFHVNRPGTPSACSTIEACDLQGLTFDAAVAWGIIFHPDPRQPGCGDREGVASAEAGRVVSVHVWRRWTAASTA